MIENGYSVKDVANHFDVTVTTVYRWIKEHNLDLRELKRVWDNRKTSHNDIYINNKKRTKELMDQGYSVKDIAGLMGLNVGTIWRYIREIKAAEEK